jgi:hypothetical protein
MKIPCPKVSIVVVLLLLGSQSFAQKITYFMINIRFDDKSRQNGFLYEVTPDTLVLIDWKLLKKSTSDIASLPKIKVPINSELKYVSVKRHNSFLRNVFLIPIVTTTLASGVSYLMGDPANHTGRPSNSFLGFNGWEQSGVFVGATASAVAITYLFPIFALPRVSVNKRTLVSGYDFTKIEKFSIRWQQNNLQ